jgi:hypothetical protein
LKHENIIVIITQIETTFSYIKVMDTFPRNLNMFMFVCSGYLQINQGMPAKGIQKEVQQVNIPYLASWPTEEHHNNVKDPDKPVN